MKETFSIVDRQRIICAVRRVSRHYQQLAAVAEALFVGCEQNYSQEDKSMLDAWARCGESAFLRGEEPNIHLATVGTMTHFGIACLLEYAKRWMKRAEDQIAALPITPEEKSTAQTTGLALSSAGGKSGKGAGDSQTGVASRKKRPAKKSRPGGDRLRREQCNPVPGKKR
jgi:hypothetical protein